ncbi:hypothetical protein FQZ97_1203630 [compost metagenome]
MAGRAAAAAFSPSSSVWWAEARVALIPRGAWAATRSASQMARGSKSSLARTSWTRPRRYASWASNSSPVSSQRMALPQPAIWCRRRVAPAKGKMPRCTSIWANRVLLAQRLMSAASINSMPMV